MPCGECEKGSVKRALLAQKMVSLLRISAVLTMKGATMLEIRASLMERKVTAMDRDASDKENTSGKS